MRRLLPLLLAAVVLSTFLSPSRRDLFVGDETKYGEVLHDTRAAHAFFVPLLNGTPFSHKPPIHFWLIELLTFPLGVQSMWAFVLPSLLAFALLLLLAARGGAELFGSRDAAWLAAFVCGTSLLVWASAQTARMDVAFTASIAAGTLLLWRFLRDRDFRALNLAAFVLAIGTLIKGPMAPIIAILLLLFEWWRRRALPRGNYFPALAISIAVPMLWVVPAILAGGRSYAHEILVKQTVGRAVSTWVHNAPPWYYLLHAPGFLVPWFFLAVIAIVALLRGRTRDERDEPARFCVSWIAAVLVPYSLMASKLDVYMMAMVPPVALLVAWLAGREPGGRALRWGRITSIVTTLLFATLGAAALLRGQAWIRGPESALLALPNVKALLVAMIGIGIVATIVLLRARSLGAVTVTLGAATFAVCLAMSLLVLPQVNELSSTRPLIAALGSQNVPGAEIALYACPYLWARDLPRELENVHYVGMDRFRDSSFAPRVLVTSRAHASEISYALPRYTKVGELRMIGKWFDVYRLAAR